MADLPRACMGGWCSARSTCARYHASAADRLHAVERLCPPGTHAAALPLVAAPQTPPPAPPAPTQPPPPPPTDTMAERDYPNSLTKRLRELAARPNGVALEELQGIPVATARQGLYNLTNLGQLHPSRSPNGHNILRWFACPQAAQAHQAAQAALRPLYIPRHRARPAVEVCDDTHRRERKAERAAARAGERAPRQSKATSPRQTAAQAWANTPAVVPADVRITYGNPPQGRMAGLCPADKLPPMRDGATDYQRHMARYQAGPGSQ